MNPSPETKTGPGRSDDEAADHVYLRGDQVVRGEDRAERYPSGIRAGSPAPGSRWSGAIVAVADGFDGLTHRRACKPAWTTGHEIMTQSRRHFDAEVVEALTRALERRSCVAQVQAA